MSIRATSCFAFFVHFVLAFFGHAIFGGHPGSIAIFDGRTEPTRAVVPNQFVGSEGNAYESAALGSATQIAQAVYGESVIAASGIPVGARFTGLAFRADQSSEPPIGVISDYQIRMATSLKPPGMLDAIFASNRGPDYIVTRSGPLVLDGSEYPSGSSPNEFGLTLDFDETFTYTGGDLLLEYTHTEIDPCKFKPDCLENSNADASINVNNTQINFALGFDSKEATFFNFNACVIVRFEYVNVGDLNCDGVVNLLDVQPFVDILISGQYIANGDINNDGAINLLDVGPFIKLLGG